MTEPVDLSVPEKAVRAYLGAVGKRLRAARSRTAFGKNESEHSFHAGIDDAQGNLLHAVVVLSVRRAKGRTRVVLLDVRQPSDTEWTEIGVPPESAWSPDAAGQIRRYFLGELEKVHEDLAAGSSVEVFRRGVLGYFNVSGLSGEYWLGPWRIGPPVDPPDAPAWGEKVVLCDRRATGRDVMDATYEFGHQLDELVLLLSVFWMNRFHAIPAEHLWFFGPFKPGENLTSHVAQRGYADRSATPAMPAPDALAPAGTYRELDRLDSFDWGEPGNTFTPPSDSPTLFERFYGADADVAEQFLAACKTYDTAQSLWSTNTTGALSYLVVTAESLLETPLAHCAECKQVRGIARATKDLFFALLPGLEPQRAELERFLSAAYSIRSRHFHDAEFVAGEFEPWSQHDILMPARIEAGETFRRLHALVNGLLVAWLMKKTGDPWARANAAPPRDRHPKHFSVSVQVGGGPNTGS
jgi:hypothetical protein